LVHFDEYLVHFGEGLVHFGDVKRDFGGDLGVFYCFMMKKVGFWVVFVVNGIEERKAGN
jgi:hypothetical protein